MKCYRCNSELRWESDADVEGNENYSVVSFLSCQSCGVWVEVYLPFGEKKLYTQTNT